ncbi:hypothetical protein [uncultured Desulfobacter sp.]|uniref:hypothetical protein n=1 Tax=uncultured Desulfobacter sp. TaxID=240139 RepID=UPI002AA684A1|nr:hypothetical protein [uncultured Desulfobacter sp.]
MGFKYRLHITKQEKQFQDSVLALSGMANVKVIDYTIVSNPWMGSQMAEIKVCWVWKDQKSKSIAVNKDSTPPPISEVEFSAALNTAVNELKSFGYDVTAKPKSKP